MIQIDHNNNTLFLLWAVSSIIDIVSSSYKAMIIYNEGELFSAGANLGEALFLGNLGLKYGDWTRFEI